MAVSSKDRVSTGKQRVGNKPAHTAGAGLCGNFLTQCFDCIHAYDIETVTGRCGEIDLPALTGQVQHFLSVYGKTLHFESTGNKYHDAAVLTDIIKENVKEMDVELVEVDKGSTVSAEFVAYKVNDGLDTSSLYFLPIAIVHCVDGQLKEILLDFFAFLSHFSLFSYPYESYEMCQALAIDYDYMPKVKYDPDLVESLSPEFKKVADRYVDGDIRELFKDIEARREALYGNQWQLVEKVRHGMLEYEGKMFYKLPSGETRSVTGLFEVMEEGLQLNTEDSLANYDIAPIRCELGDESFCEEEGYSDEMISMDSLFMFCYGWGDGDRTVERAINTFNQDNGSMGYPVLIEVEKISDCKGKVEPSDYPKRWYEWYEKLITFIYE